MAERRPFDANIAAGVVRSNDKLTGLPAHRRSPPDLRQALRHQRSWREV